MIVPPLQMLQLKNITEEQVTEILLTEFPDYLSLEESRERLELEIIMRAQEYQDSEPNPECKKLYDPDDPETSVCISPLWIYSALLAYHWKPDPVKIEKLKNRFNSLHFLV